MRLSLLLTAVVFSGIVPAQDQHAGSDSTLSARQLFYTKRKAAAEKPAAPPKAAPKPAEKAAAPVKPQTPDAPRTGEVTPYLGLRYSIQQVAPNGSLQEVDPERTFRSGDRIKIRLQANDRGYLYIVHQGSSGNWDVLFPSAGIKGGSNELAAGQTVTVPSGDEEDFEFDEKPGLEKVFIVLSAVRENNLDTLIYSLGKSSAAKAPMLLAGSRPPSIPDSELSRLRPGLVSRDLRVEKRPAAKAGNGGRENAVYVVNTSATKDQQRVVAEVSLTHK